MVTTRRSSFGVQDGDTLALRSKSTPTSAETTPTRKRKEYALEARSSSRKKPKSSGLDGTDDAPVEAEHPDSTSVEGGKSMDGPTSKPDSDMAIAPAEGGNGRVQESTAWLAEDFVPLSTEPSLELAGAGAEKENDISNTVVDTQSPDDPPTNGLDLDANHETKATDSATKPSADQDILHTPQEADNTADQQPSTQIPPVQHKRFGCSEPEPIIEEEPTANGPRPQDAELTPGVPNATTTNDADDNDDSDDDAPEAIGSKSVVKHAGPRLKAAKRAKRKPKSTKAASAKQKPDTATVAPEPAAAVKDPFLIDVDPQPENLNVSTKTPPEPPLLHALSPSSTQPQTTADATHPPSKKRKLKLFNNENAKTPKDIVKAGVTYRTIPNEAPETLASKKHKATHLPPRSNAGSWRLKKQVLGRKKVQHVWGGRSAFLRT